MPKKPKYLTYEKDSAKERRRKELRKAGKLKSFNKRNRDDSPRRKTWLDNLEVDLAELDGMADERVMRGEYERRKAIEKQELPEMTVFIPEREATLQGLVLEVSTGLCRVQVGDKLMMCSMRGSLTAEETGYTNVVAVGDQVYLSENDDGTGVVEGVGERRSAVTRPDPFYAHLKHILVANVDQMLIVASWRNPHFWAERIDRYLVSAERSEIAVLLAVNKIDLAESMEEVHDTLQPYYAMGLNIFLTSALTGEGIVALHDHLHDKTTMLAGLSGVGKSSLLSALEPGFELKTGEISEKRNEGRHTTTQALMLPFGDGYVVDTPGLKEFGLFGMKRSELADYYPEMLDVAHECHFANCQHIFEPECAVRAAVDAGGISAMRYDSYRRIYITLPE